MKKEWIKIGILFLVTVGAVFWALNYLFLSGRTAQKSKAAGETIALSFNPASPNPKSGEDFAVTLQIKPSKNVSLRGYYILLPFDETNVQIKSIEYKVGVVSDDFGDTTNTVAAVNKNGLMDIQGEIQNQSGFVVGANTTVDLMRLVFTKKTALALNMKPSKVIFYTVESTGLVSTTTLATAAMPTLEIQGEQAPASTCVNFSDNFSDLNSASWQVVTSNSGTVTAPNGVGTINNKAGGGEVENTGINYKKTVKGDFSTELLLKSLRTVDNKIGGNLELNIIDSTNANNSLRIARNFNSGAIVAYHYKGSSTPTDQASQNIGLSATTPVKAKIEIKGTEAKMYYDLLDGQGYRLFKTFNNVFTAEAKLGIFSFNMAPDYPAATATFDDFKLTCNAPTGTPAPTGGGSGNVKLNLKLKFQGVSSKPTADPEFAKTNVKFTLDGGNLKTPLVETSSFTADDKGIWSGQVSFNLSSPANQKYILYAKGQQHVQKKICDVAPTESSPGTYHCTNENFTLAVGDNNRDLSGIMLLSGDIYGPNDGQDGVVNSIDLSYVKNHLGKTGLDEKSHDIRKICDINKDNRCDTQDYSLIISSLSIKSDEY